jgi:predicted AlkP superfamily pyrophosphatase or phosphodiesterase
MKTIKRVSVWIFAVCLAAALGACASLPGAAVPPKLVVFLVVDGLPQRQVTAYRDQLAPDGLARLLDRGAWFSDAHYGHAVTVTAAGHATLFTGASPQRTGIIGNDWRDVNTGAEVYNTGDVAAIYIGHKTQALDGTSPKNLKAETIGDVMRRVDPRSKVVTVSGKDRGAILPAGQRGTAYMYMSATGQFASSTHYMAAHPPWVDAFNGGKSADRYFKTEWQPLLPDAAYAQSLPDSQPWFGPRGGKLPMMMGVTADDAPGPVFYTALLRSPFGDALTLDFARAAIAGEKLGQGAAPDLLAVSLSGHDYINHAYSAESRISHDHLLHLDRMLQAFFASLDSTVGNDNYLVVLSADHGFMPAPEASQAQDIPSGRAAGAAMLAGINEALEKQFGALKLIPFLSASALVVDRKLVAERGLDLKAVTAAARTALLREESIAAAYTRIELQDNTRAGAPHFDAMRRTWHADVSGDVQFALKRNRMMGPAVATHGSPHDYDTHVPVMLYGPKWIKPGRIDSRVDVVDIVPTLARLLNVPLPAQAEGKPLPITFTVPAP